MRYLGAIALAVCTNQRVLAQTSRSDPVDLQGWYGVNLRLDLPNGWKTSLQYRLRTIDNASHVRGSYYTVGGEKKIRDGMWLLANYRLATVDNGTFHRGALGAEFARDVGDNTISLRGLAQYQRQNFTDNDESDEDFVVRTRLEIQRQMASRLDLYLSTEPFFTAGDGYVVDNWRNTVGMKIEYMKGRKLDLFYIYRPDYAKTSYNRTFHIVGVDLDFNVKIKRKASGS